MRKIILLLIVLISLCSFVIADLNNVVLGKNEGRIIVNYREKTIWDNFDFKPYAIIPTYVNANSEISFKGELALKTSGVFRCPTSTELWVNIYNFDASKTQFIGTKYNSFIIPFPSEARNILSNQDIVIWDAKMITPSVKGKYRYEAYLVGCPDTKIDYDSFTVENDVPELCDLPSITTTYQDIDNGKLKIVTLIEYVGLDCIKSEVKTYNAICDNGYESKGSGASSYCSKLPVITTTTTTTIPLKECEEYKEKDLCKTNEKCTWITIEESGILGFEWAKSLCVEKSQPIKIEDLEDKTNKQLTESACFKDSDCTNDNCRSINSLIRDDFLDETDEGFWEDVSAADIGTGVLDAVLGFVIQFKDQKIEPEGICVEEEKPSEEPFDISPCSWGEDLAKSFTTTTKAKKYGCIVGYGIIIFLIIIIFMPKK